MSTVEDSDAIVMFLVTRADEGEHVSHEPQRADTDHPWRRAELTRARPHRARQRTVEPVIPAATRVAPVVRRRCCPEEIQVTMLGSLPVVAAAIARADPTWSHVTRVGATTPTWTDGTATWEVSLHTRPGRRRSARLQLFGSPSEAVTVLTLVPTHPRSRPSAAFIRRGLAAMITLRDDLTGTTPADEMSPTPAVVAGTRVVDVAEHPAITTTAAAPPSPGADR